MELKEDQGSIEITEENKKKEPEGGIKMKICFIIFGIGSLLTWNAILSDVGFFINFQG